MSTTNMPQPAKSSAINMSLWQSQQLLATKKTHRGSQTAGAGAGAGAGDASAYSSDDEDSLGVRSINSDSDPPPPSVHSLELDSDDDEGWVEVESIGNSIATLIGDDDFDSCEEGEEEEDDDDDDYVARASATRLSKEVSDGEDDVEVEVEGKTELTTRHRQSTIVCDEDDEDDENDIDSSKGHLSRTSSPAPQEDICRATTQTQLILRTDRESHVSFTRPALRSRRKSPFRELKAVGTMASAVNAAGEDGFVVHHFDNPPHLVDCFYLKRVALTRSECPRVRNENSAAPSRQAVGVTPMEEDQEDELEAHREGPRVRNEDGAAPSGEAVGFASMKEDQKDELQAPNDAMMHECARICNENSAAPSREAVGLPPFEDEQEDESGAQSDAMRFENVTLNSWARLLLGLHGEQQSPAHRLSQHRMDHLVEIIEAAAERPKRSLEL